MFSIKDHLATLVDARIKEPPVANDWIRASGFAFDCMREEVLAHRHQKHREEVWDADSVVNLSLGTAMHIGMQDLLLSALLIGTWECTACGKIHGTRKSDADPELRRIKYHTPHDQLTSADRQAFRYLIDRVVLNAVPKPVMCGAESYLGVCDSEEFRYVESWVGDLDLRIGGHPDGFLRVPWQETVGIFEGKSISQKGIWEVRAVPKVEHLYQVHIYMWATGLTWANVLYWCKGPHGIKAFVEHHVERQEPIIEMIKDVVGEYRAAIGQPLAVLPRRICKHAYCKRALECVVVEPCFDVA